MRERQEGCVDKSCGVGALAVAAAEVEGVGLGVSLFVRGWEGQRRLTV